MKGLRGIEGARPRASRRAPGLAALAYDPASTNLSRIAASRFAAIRQSVAGYFASELRSSADGAKK